MGDQGALALIDDAKRARALSLVRAGRLYDLGRVLDEAAPVFPGRHFRQTLVTTAHHANPGGGLGDNDVNWITEVFSGTTQIGTHLDALCHLQEGDRMYGGLRVCEVAAPGGVTRLGIETVPQIVTRGVLVDRLAPATSSRPTCSTAWRSSPATPCCSTPAGARTGTTLSATCPASRAPAWRWRAGWLRWASP
jgi:Putative cyclase